MNPISVLLFAWGFYLGRRTKMCFLLQLLGVILGMVLGSAST